RTRVPITAEVLVHTVIQVPPSRPKRVRRSSTRHGKRSRRVKPRKGAATSAVGDQATGGAREGAAPRTAEGTWRGWAWLTVPTTFSAADTTERGAASTTETRDDRWMMTSAKSP